MRIVDRALEWIAPPRCAACELRLVRDAVFCGRCFDTLEPSPALPEGTTAAFAFGGALADAVRAMKFQRRVDLIRPMQRLVVERLPARDGIDLVAPVPLHRARLRHRGFDQAALLARVVAFALGRPLVVDLLERIVETPQLARLDAAARVRAVENAFRVPSELRRGTRVLIVDDVRTTGATLRAAASVLCAAGAIVSAHVLAATPRE